MMMELIWLEIWLMGILTFRDRIMKVIRLPRVRIFPLEETTSAPPMTAPK